VIIKQLSEQIDISENEIDAIVSSYYKEIRKTLSGMEHIKVNIIGLGDFMMRRDILKSSLKKSKDILSNSGTNTFEEYHSKKSSEEKIAKLTKAIDMVEAFIERINKFRNEKKVQRNMEEQNSDTGGNQE
jgi:hypothetical protein